MKDLLAVWTTPGLCTHAWEDHLFLLTYLEAVTPPTSFDEWADTLRARGWTVHWTPLAAISQGPYRGGSTVHWTPLAAISQGPYRGGSVVEVIAAAGSLSLLPLGSAWPTGQIIAATDGTHRSYVAVPRAALPLAINLSVGVETPRAVVVAQG